MAIWYFRFRRTFPRITQRNEIDHAYYFAVLGMKFPSTYPQLNFAPPPPKHHPQLKTLGACTHGEPFLIISELMELGSLDQWVHKNKQSITFKMIIQLALEITHGLHHLHQEGIVHRDIKPENILLCKDRNQEHIVHAKLAGGCLSLLYIKHI